MHELEKQVHDLVPDMPVRAVIYAFQYGCTVAEILALSGLTGPELARAKIRLPNIRRAAMQLGVYDDASMLEAIRGVLADARAASNSERFGPELSSLREQLASNKADIGRHQICLQTSFSRLATIDAQIRRASSSDFLGRRSRDQLQAMRTDIAIEAELHLRELVRLADHRLRLLTHVTILIDSTLCTAGCDIREVHSAGGTQRTARTVYRRTGRPHRPQPAPFPEEVVAACKELLGRLRLYETATLTLRRSAAAELNHIKENPWYEWSPMDTTDHRCWSGAYWALNSSD